MIAHSDKVNQHIVPTAGQTAIWDRNYQYDTVLYDKPTELHLKRLSERVRRGRKNEGKKTRDREKKKRKRRKKKREKERYKGLQNVNVRKKMAAIRDNVGVLA